MNSLLIGIAGGTGSGKSTFTNKLKDCFGDRITILYHDSYYKRHDELSFDERKLINYDHPDSLETDLLIDHLRRLKAGEAVDCPVYDFRIHNRTDEIRHVEPREVILVEGILTLQNETLRNLFDIKIYVEADADERIMRRAMRDMSERGRDLEGIFEQYVTTVKPMHYMYVEPTKAYADIIINSGMNKVAFDLVKTKIESVIGK